MSHSELHSLTAPSLLARVDRAAGDLRRGVPVILQAGETRLLCLAAETLTDAQLKSMLDHGAVLALTPERAQILRMRLYTGDTAFLDLDPKSDQRWTANKIRTLADPSGDLDNPWRGPFVARREAFPGPAKQAIKLAKLAKLLPAMILVDWDGREAGGLTELAASDIDAYDLEDARGLTLVASAPVPLAGAEETSIYGFRPQSGGTEHYAIVVGNPSSPGPVLVRVHSECFTGDLLGSLKCDCGEQLRGAITRMGEEGEGIVLYMAQEGRGIGLINKLRAYDLQHQGFDTMEANGRLGFEDDERLFEPAAEMLKRLGITKVRLLTNNPDKPQQLEAHGIEVVETVGHKFAPNPHNEAYLLVKKDKAGHDL